ncbi:hypothetical protein A6P39_042790 (plasmid) [Streptomyces sp. FXJ1.172]|uniref:hypothetical protein n=1 Tax=Streptomyces sp. FXJ1.172 TaxID=710705 RepID=UPI0023DD37FD|nr:hypothetical protein [Streptomyces sp. FXJ1.172]WEP00893.1 hypothetical protein A6P39_042790 [Streptomyces sp. FXJ1.172]
MRSARREPALWPAACTWAVLVLAVVACWLHGRGSGSASGAGRVAAGRMATDHVAAGRMATDHVAAGRMATDHVAAGRVCRSELPRGMELSCGTYGFGDLRYACPAKTHDGVRCVRTSQVTVRNSGRSRVYVTYIAGPRPGVLDEGPRRTLGPGRAATLRPGGGRLLFDITLRGAANGPSSLEVVRVR